MKEQTIELWDVWNNKHWICITTNGFVKKNGRAVMGRGCAAEARNKFKDLDLKLGDLINYNGNVVHIFPMWNLLTFPTKHNWWESSDIELIKQSCKQLTDALDKLAINEVYLPRPGCGNGGLDWDDVKSHIESLLDDRIVIVSN